MLQTEIIRRVKLVDLIARSADCNGSESLGISMMSEGFNIIYDGPPLKINLGLALIIDTKQPLGIESRVIKKSVSSTVIISKLVPGYKRGRLFALATRPVSYEEYFSSNKTI